VRFRANIASRGRDLQIKTLRTRIVVWFAALLLAVEAAGLVLINEALSRNTAADIEQRLTTAERVVTHITAENERQLAQAASVLSADFAFRSAIATGDRETIRTALLNQAQRAGADTAMLCSLDGRVIAHVQDAAAEGRAFAFPALLAAAERDGHASAVVQLRQRAEQLVVVPVLAPVPLAWLAMGFASDDAALAALRDLGGTQVSLAARDDVGRWALLASTLPAASRERLAASLNTLPDGGARRVDLQLGDERYRSQLLPLGGAGRAPVSAVLQLSVREAMAPLRELQQRLLALALASMLATVAAGLLIARSIARPVTQLADWAGRVEQGEYAQPVQIARQDELGALARAFDHMRSAIAAREARISDLAYVDPLTRLPNRAWLAEQLAARIERARHANRPLAVLVMDLDGFKEVNDALGHGIGDELLRDVARRLHRVVDRDSGLCARLGGDEFAVIAESLDGAGATRLAQALGEVLDAPVSLQGVDVVAGASIGVAIHPEHGGDAGTLVRCAEAAMYRAKREKVQLALYDGALDEPDPTRVTLMAELRQAAQRGELLLHYQPKVRLADGEVRHAEALLRWQHPQRGLVPPDRFIPAAEQTGYIRSLTRWVLDAALAQAAAWRRSGLEVQIAVNLSVRDLLDTALPAQLDDLLRQRQASPQWLALEVTESAVMSDPARALSVVRDLHERGFALALDDFGTGYSSLSYLKRLPVDELKIDKSFVRNLAHESDDATIVASTIELAHRMGLRVVAEGVEDRAAWQLLQRMGCDFIQGYLISRPLRADEFARWLQQPKAPLAMEQS
jgi:diguanylate cyclase (GGDEF)-like protein